MKKRLYNSYLHIGFNKLLTGTTAIGRALQMSWCACTWLYGTTDRQIASLR